MANGLFTLKQQVQALREGAWSGYIAPKWVEYLVVSGGGGGGGNGGGGAGGLLTGIVTVATGASYTVTVGAGGAPTGGASAGSQGVNSIFGIISSFGGGGGGSGALPTSDMFGGSGGGGGTLGPGQGVSGQGNIGGATIAGKGGGGGGAGSKGIDYSGIFGGNGGAGIASSISGIPVVYAAGGGGGTNGSAIQSSGGVGGGGAGGSTTVAGASGAANTGGGAGGGGNVSYGTGGSGIVVVRYPGTVQFFTGGTLSYANGYIIHTFFASGTLAPTTPTVYIDTPYQISRSLRFNSADTAYLNRTPASAGNRRTWTFSAWVKRSTSSASGETLFGIPGSTTDTTFMNIGFFNGTLLLSTSGRTLKYPSNQLRDHSAWYHIVVVLDTTAALNDDRINFYINGVKATSFGGSETITQNTEFGINQASIHYLGTYDGGTNNKFSGLMTEINFIDGQALTPSAFGYINPTTGVWAPHKFVGTYGTNGFYLKFADNSNTTAATLGADSSGNGNNWTPNNFSVTAGAGNESLVDTPTQYGTDTGVGGEVRGNYATLNPIAVLVSATGSATWSNGNLDFAPNQAEGSTAISAISTIICPSSGKWYWEVTPSTVATAAASRSSIGIMNINSLSNLFAAAAGAVGAYVYHPNGYKSASPSNTGYAAYGATYTSSDVIGVALDMDAGTLVFYKNGASQGTAYTGLSGEYFPAIGYWITASINFGQRAFAYTAPSGYKALCTQNLPTPTIGATTATQANKYFNPLLYTGTGSSLDLTGVGFQPDWVWVKGRSNTQSHAIWDSVRGVQKYISSNATAAETTQSTGLTSFNSDGFTVGTMSQLNTSAYTYVAWNWKAGGTAVTNSSGTITSQVSANPTAGFSVVTYTNSSSGTVGHGLGVAPAMVIYKSRSNGYNWVVIHQGLTNMTGYYLNLDGTGAASNTLALSGSPTSSVIYTNSNVMASSDLAVAYCFAEVTGYSKFGSFTGNGSADGPFVYTGFKPVYVMIKKTNSTSDWLITDAARDTYNVVTKELDAELSTAESSGFSFFDYLSNGFKNRGTNPAWNTNGDTYIYMAFASNPFKHSLAR